MLSVLSNDYSSGMVEAGTRENSGGDEGLKPPGVDGEVRGW
jgi:hypothetical protein